MYHPVGKDFAIRLQYVIVWSPEVDPSLQERAPVAALCNLCLVIFKANQTHCLSTQSHHQEPHPRSGSTMQLGSTNDAAAIMLWEHVLNMPVLVARRALTTCNIFWSLITMFLSITPFFYIHRVLQLRHLSFPIAHVLCGSSFACDTCHTAEDTALASCVLINMGTQGFDCLLPVYSVVQSLGSWLVCIRGCSRQVADAVSDVPRVHKSHFVMHQATRRQLWVGHPSPVLL